MEYEEKWREVEKDQDGGQRRRSGRRSKADGERDFKGKRERGTTVVEDVSESAP